MCDKHIADLPASWAHALEKDGHQAPVTTNGNANGANGHANGHAAGVPESFLDDKAVRTVYGLVPLRHALDWPIFASYDELTGCAAYMGGRIPTLEEARSIYAHVDVLKKDEAEKQLGKMVPAVNGYVSALWPTRPGPSFSVCRACERGTNPSALASHGSATSPTTACTKRLHRDPPRPPPPSRRPMPRPKRSLPTSTAPTSASSTGTPWP